MAVPASVLLPWINSAGAGGVRNSMVAYQGDGGTTEFDFNFSGGYINQSDVKAYIYDTESGLTAPWTPVFLGPNTVKYTPALPATKYIVIYRDTQKTQPLVNFSTGAPMTEENLDMTAEQSVFAAAEMVDRFDSVNSSSADAIVRSYEALTKADSALDASAAATATADDARAKAVSAESKADAAVSTANHAESVANGIDGKAQQALDNSVGATNIANNAQTIAQGAENTANGIDGKATTALSNSATAVSTANAAAASVATALQKTANLSDVANAASARANLTVWTPSESFGEATVVGLAGGQTGAQTIGIGFKLARLRNAAGQYVSVQNSAQLNLNYATANAAGGRDIAGNFAAQWTHVWVIWNGTALALIASASMTAPTLPTGYTHYAYVCPVRIGTANNILAFAVRGNRVFYPQGAGYAIWSTTIGNVTMPLWNTYVPPNATVGRISGAISFRVDSNGNIDMAVSFIPWNNALQAINIPIRLIGQGIGSDNTLYANFEMYHNNGGDPVMNWAMAVGGATPSAYLYATGFDFAIP